MQAVANLQWANWPSSFAGLGAGSLLGNVEIVAVCRCFHRGAGFQLQRDEVLRGLNGGALGCSSHELGSK